MDVALSSKYVSICNYFHAKLVHSSDNELFKQHPNLTPPRRHQKVYTPAKYKGKPHMTSCQFCHSGENDKMFGNRQSLQNKMCGKYNGYFKDPIQKLALARLYLRKGRPPPVIACHGAP